LKKEQKPVFSKKIRVKKNKKTGGLFILKKHEFLSTLVDETYERRELRAWSNI